MALSAMVLSGCATQRTESPASALGDAGAREARVPGGATIDELRAAVAAKPDDAKLHYKLGNALFDAGRYEAAMSSYDAALEIAPNHARALTNKGLCLRRLGRVEEAIDMYRQSLAIDPGDFTTMQNLAFALEVLGRFDEAIPLLRKLADMAPDDVQVLSDLADVLLFEKWYQEAAEVYERLVELDPGVAGDYYNLGLCYFSLEKWDDALAAWTTALAYEPDDPKTNKGLAVVHWRRGDYDMAWEAVKRCRELGLSLDPAFITALQNDSGRLGPG